MALPGYRLKPGTVDRVAEALGHTTDTSLARHLGIARATITRARTAETTNGTADTFVGHAMHATAWPFQEFYEPTPTRSNRAAA